MTADTSATRKEVAAVLSYCCDCVAWAFVDRKPMEALEEKQIRAWGAEFRRADDRLRLLQDKGASTASSTRMRTRVLTGGGSTHSEPSSLPLVGLRGVQQHRYRQLGSSSSLPSSTAATPEASPRSRNRERFRSGSSMVSSLVTATALAREGMLPAKAVWDGSSLADCGSSGGGGDSRRAAAPRRPLWTKLMSGPAPFASEGWAFGEENLKLRTQPPPPNAKKGMKAATGKGKRPARKQNGEEEPLPLPSSPRASTARSASAVGKAAKAWKKKAYRSSKVDASPKAGGAAMMKHERADDFMNRRFSEMAQLQVDTVEFEGLGRKERERLRQAEDDEVAEAAAAAAERAQEAADEELADRRARAEGRRW